MNRFLKAAKMKSFRRGNVSFVLLLSFARGFSYCLFPIAYSLGQSPRQIRTYRTAYRSSIGMLSSISARSSSRLAFSRFQATLSMPSGPSSGYISEGSVRTMSLVRQQ